MFPLVEFPKIVQHYAPFFESVFSADAFIEFKRYISGLIVSENKTVDEINRLFVVESRNQSSLNHLLTCQPVFVGAFEPSPPGGVGAFARDADQTQRGAQRG